MYAEVVENYEIKKLCIDIADKLNLVGSINIQLRILNNKATIFEINPRFSSTVLFRHSIGFSDLVWSLIEAENKIVPSYEESINFGK